MKGLVPTLAVVLVITSYFVFLFIPSDPFSVKTTGALLGIICFGLGVWRGEAATPASTKVRFMRSLGTLGIVITGVVIASFACLYFLGEFEALHREGRAYGILDCSGEAADDVTAAFPRLAETFGLSPTSTGPDSYAKEENQKWYVANRFEEVYVCFETSEKTVSVLVYVSDWGQEDERELQKFISTLRGKLEAFENPK